MKHCNFKIWFVTLTYVSSLIVISTTSNQLETCVSLIICCLRLFVVYKCVMLLVSEEMVFETFFIITNNTLLPEAICSLQT